MFVRLCDRLIVCLCSYVLVCLNASVLVSDDACLTLPGPAYRTGGRTDGPDPPTREGVPKRRTPRPEVLTRSVERRGAKGYLISPSQALGSSPALHLSGS